MCNGTRRARNSGKKPEPWGRETLPLLVYESSQDSYPDACDERLETGIAAMRSEGRVGDVSAAIQRYIESQKMAVVRDYTGHGIGREMHEEPQVPNFVSDQLRGRGDFTLEPGLVIAVEPMVNIGVKQVKLLPDHWTQATKDGKWSAHFEHTIAMTSQGPYILTAAPGEGRGPELEGAASEEQDLLKKAP